MATLRWIEQMLKDSGVPYDEIRHPSTPTSQGLAEQQHTSGHNVAKVVVAVAHGKPLQLVLPADRKVDINRIREIAGDKQARLAGESELAAWFEECEVGATPPFPHWKDVGLWMDSAMRVRGKILFEAGTHEDAIRMEFDDWVRLAKPRLESFSAEEQPRKAIAL